jgi:hypothetical protein
MISLYRRPLKNNAHHLLHVAIVSELKQPLILISHQSEYARSTAIQFPKSYGPKIIDLPHNTKLTVAGSQRSLHPYVTGLSNGFLNHPLAGILPSSIYQSSLRQSFIYKIVGSRLYGQLLSLLDMANGLRRGRVFQTIRRLCKSVSTLQRKA